MRSAIPRGPIPLRSNSNDLWALAAAELNSDDAPNINFSGDKLNILTDLHSLTEQSRVKCIEKRWHYTRKSGEKIIFRDLFTKMVKWIDLFKQVGDCAVQYDPVHAALPWAGVRFLLQIAVNDIRKFSFAVESATSIAEILCRYAILENLYLRHESDATNELKKALVQCYAAVLVYLSKVKSYFEKNPASRAVRSALLDETDLNDRFGRIRVEQVNVDRCIGLVDAQLSKRNEILRWISPEPYLQYHEQTKKDVLLDSGKWLLSDPIFVKWKKESASSILWLHGIPGSGKSKLVSIVIEDALKDYHSGHSSPPVFFYCSRNPAEPRRANPEAILASIVRQLSGLGPRLPLLDPVVAKYQKKEDQGFASGPLDIDESCALIIQLAEHYPMITLIIDALDECDPGKRAELLDVLEKILRESSGLIKIFISSRDDQDIVFTLKDYPNLEIASDRNKDDVARFVRAEVQKLVKKGKLLRYSCAKEKLTELIVEKVIEGAAGMFRWASMQLQYLCSLKAGDDIQERLGRIPPDLESLYAEIYGSLWRSQGEAQIRITKNALSWLLCAQQTLNSGDFLAMVTITPKRNYAQVSKDQILDFCCNFVVYDATLDVFRFAHLSVREFLEKQPEYSITAVNSLAAEICLIGLISASKSLGARRLLEQRAHILQDTSFTWYLDLWPVHCQLAGDRRTDGVLMDLLRFFLLEELDSSSPFALWTEAGIDRLYRLNLPWETLEMMRSSYYDSAESADRALLFGCAFDIFEVVQWHIARPISRAVSEQALCIALKHLSYQVVQVLLVENHVQITEKVVEVAAENYNEAMKLLLEKRGAEIKITERVVEAAAKNKSSSAMALLLEQRGAEIKITENVVIAALRRAGTEVMALLLEQRGTEIKITEKVVIAAARNSDSIMALLLEQRGAEIKITEEVVIAAARNSDSIMALLLEQHGTEIQITEEVAIAAAGNLTKKVMALLLEQRGAEIKITEEVIIVAARRGRVETMALLLEKRGAEIKITEEVVKAAVRNWYTGEENLTFLLERRGAEIKITEEMVKEVERKQEQYKEMMAWLREQRHTEIQITEELEPSRGQGNEMMEWLGYYYGTPRALEVTEEVVEAAEYYQGRGE